MSKNEVVNADDGFNEENEEVPSFLYGAENTGLENIEDTGGFTELRVCTKMSKVFEEGEVELGHIYNNETSEDLGEYRELIIFKYRITHQLSNENNDKILCKSYDRKIGNIRVYNDDDEFDVEAIKGLDITEEELLSEEIRIVNRECDGCPFHPIDSWHTDPETGKRTPPRGKLCHEYYAIDITDAEFDENNGRVINFNKTPFLIRIMNTSKPKQDIIEDINNIINNKLRLNTNSEGKSLPIFAGKILFGATQITNARKKKNWLWDIRWGGYIQKNELKLAKFAEKMLIEYNKDEKSRNEKIEEQLAKSGGGSINVEANVDEQSGSAFGNNADVDDNDADDGNSDGNTPPPWAGDGGNN